ncbi:MAG: sulfurtransferase TusA family protein [Candidatus Dormibacteria bacterium]
MKIPVLSILPRATPPDGFLDLRGMPNPEPILELARAAQTWDDGETVRILSDDACFPTDFMRWAGGSDLQIISLRYPTGDLTEVIMRR